MTQSALGGKSILAVRAPETEKRGMESISISSPVGPLTLTVKDGALLRLEWREGPMGQPTGVLAEAVDQLRAYFDGTLRDFSIPIAPQRSETQQRFADALRAIPYGETRTYGDLASDLGMPAQAIGQCCGANPVPILIPCHRVLAANGLGGFSGGGGIEAKVALLKHEGAASLLI